MKLNRRNFLATTATASLAADSARAQGRPPVISIALAARSVSTLNPSVTTLGADNWACRQIYDTLVIPDDSLSGLYHVGARPIDKDSLLRLIAKAYGKSTVITRDDGVIIDRSLNAERFEATHGVLQRFPIRLAAHNNTHEGRRLRLRFHAVT